MQIGNQDDDVLKTIMRAMFLQFSKNLDIIFENKFRIK